MQPYPYPPPPQQGYNYNGPPPPQPYGGYPTQPNPQGVYAPTSYTNYPPPPPPQAGCYALPNTGPYPPPPPPQPTPLQAYSNMPPNAPLGANYASGGPGYPPMAVPVNNYDPRRNEYRY